MVMNTFVTPGVRNGFGNGPIIDVAGKGAYVSLFASITNVSSAGELDLGLLWSHDGTAWAETPDEPFADPFPVPFTDAGHHLAKVPILGQKAQMFWNVDGGASFTFGVTAVYFDA